jgi:hypothetical protein
MTPEVLAPAEWMPGITNNLLLPSVYSVGIFTGKEIATDAAAKGIANNPAARIIRDIVVPEFITDYDDRRLNFEHSDFGEQSAWGPAQTVKITARKYAFGRHRAMRLRVPFEVQYDDEYNYTDPGQNAVDIDLASEGLKRWRQEILGPEIDRYNFFAIANGHMSGRFVQHDPDKPFTGSAEEGHWVRTPGDWAGEGTDASFAPIITAEYNKGKIRQLLFTVKASWTNLYIPTENRMVIMDPFYEEDVLAALIGTGVPMTEKGVDYLVNGEIKKLVGWDFKFDIPSDFFPTIYVDSNGNVVHSADGQSPYDLIVNSKGGSLYERLKEASRSRTTNYIRTSWDNEQGKFVTSLTNYPVGGPGRFANEGAPMDYEGTNGNWNPNEPYNAAPMIGLYNKNSSYNTKATGANGNIRLRKTIGFFIYRPAAQISQQYDSMYTGDGTTGVLRGKFKEYATDIKYDAWVIEQLSAGIIPILDSEVDDPFIGVPVTLTSDIPDSITSIDWTVTPSAPMQVGTKFASLEVHINYEGNTKPTVTYSSSDTDVVTVTNTGVITAASTGSAIITASVVQGSGQPQTIQHTVNVL